MTDYPARVVLLETEEVIERSSLEEAFQIGHAMHGYGMRTVEARDTAGEWVVVETIAE